MSERVAPFHSYRHSSVRASSVIEPLLRSQLTMDGRLERLGVNVRQILGATKVRQSWRWAANIALARTNVHSDLWRLRAAHLMQTQRIRSAPMSCGGSLQIFRTYSLDATAIGIQMA